MRTVLTHLYHLFAHLNGFGLFILGVLDSSFLFLPFGNDLLLVTMTAREHARLPYLAIMATAGSLLGCLITDVISRKGGEAGLERKFSRRRLEYVRKKITKNAGSALGVAALMPPPFPFNSVCRSCCRTSISEKETALDTRSMPLWALFYRRLAGSPGRREDSPMGPISRHVLHSSRNLGFVAGWDRIFTLFLVQALNCCTIGEKLNCVRMPRQFRDNVSSALPSS